MVKSSNIGMPRIGRNLELIMAIDDFKNGKIDEAKLLNIGKQIRHQNFSMQFNAGIDIIPCNDFSFYDHVLDTSVLLGNIPRRYYWEGGKVSMEIYFAAVFGHKKDKFDVHGMSFNKWFNTPYHYIIPEFDDGVDFAYSDNKVILEYLEAKSMNINPKIVILGPISYLMLGNLSDNDENKDEIIDEIMIVYEEFFRNLKRIKVQSIQIDEPFLVTDLSTAYQEDYAKVYNKIRSLADDIKITIGTYFGGIGNNTELVFSLPIDEVHVDLVSAPNDVEHYLKHIGNKSLSIGIVDGKNCSINNIEASCDTISSIIDKIGDDKVTISPSCSLMHLPLDVDLDKSIPEDKKHFVAFAKQKLEEVSLITKIINSSKAKFKSEISQNKDAINRISEISKSITTIEPSKSRIADTSGVDGIAIKSATVGAMPNQFDRYSGEIILYKSLTKDIKDKIDNAVKLQESLDIDILNYGEFERSDDTEYFASHLENVIIPKNSWIQRSGHKLYRPPIIFGNINASKTLVSECFAYASSITDRKIKVCLPGSISFVSESYVIPFDKRKDLMLQFSKFIADEIKHLKEKGCSMIQINESLIKDILSLRLSENISQINDIKDILSTAISTLDKETKVFLYIANLDISDIAEDFHDLGTDGLLIGLSNNYFNSLDSFSGHKHEGYIGFGLCDIDGIYVPSKVELQNNIMKTIRVFDPKYIIAMPTFDLRNSSHDQIEKFFTNLNQSIVEIRKRSI
jgi:5-methyltetrahydropteroyltriglutamate--homocysteine methyltransferase